MSLKFITVPAAVKIAGGKLTYSFAEGISFLIDHAPDFSRPQSQIRAGARIVNAFEGIEPGCEVELRLADWQLLQTTVDSAATPWGLWQMTVPGPPDRSEPLHIPPRTFLHWVDAIDEAKNNASLKDKNVSITP